LRRGVGIVIGFLRVRIGVRRGGWGRMLPIGGMCCVVGRGVGRDGGRDGGLMCVCLNRFFWLALYAQPGLWVALALIAVLKLEFKWLSLVGTSNPPSF